MLFRDGCIQCTRDQSWISLLEQLKSSKVELYAPVPDCTHDTNPPQAIGTHHPILLCQYKK